MKNLIMLVLILVGSVKSYGAPGQFGRYVGVLKHQRLNKEQLAKIDFVVSRTEGNEIDLKAVLTLHFGDFKSGEYVSYHFDKVQYNLLTGALTFDQSEEDVTISASRFSNGEFIGQLRSTTSGRIGELKLKMGVAATPTLPLIEPVTGEYRSQCEGRDSYLQLHTMRSIEDTSRIGNPFGAYDIKGQVGDKNDRVSCPEYLDRACNKANFESGSYNFYNAELVLIGDLKNMVCKIDDKGMTCGQCRYERNSRETLSRVFLPPQATPAFSSKDNSDDEPALETPPTSLSGPYEGYLHHEYLDRYQPVNLDLVTYQGQNEGQSNLRISAVATMFFGERYGSESLSYRFEPTNYPNPLVRPQFVLSRLEDDVDAFLKITSVENGVIKGEWHSLLFGRVGTFEVRKEGFSPVTIPSEAKILKPISASYEDNDWNLDLKIFQARTPPNTENPFFPLQFGGTIAQKVIGPKEPISGGSYDFYTGKIAFSSGLDSRSGPRWAIGWRNVDDRLATLMTSNGYGTIMPKFEQPRIFSLSSK